MKKILFSLIASAVIWTAQAQERNMTRKTTETRIVNSGDTARVIADSTIVEIKNNGEKKKVKIVFEYGNDSMDKVVGDRGIRSSENKKNEESKAYAGIVFGRFDLGLTKLLDDGSLTLSPENEFLEYRSWKTINVGFDVLEMGYKFSDHFKMHIAAGFDWTHLRLKEDILFQEDTKPLSYVASDVNYDKNRFTASYLRIPLTFELRTKETIKGERINFSFGPMAGILLQGSQKLKSSEEGKRKVKDDFNFAPFTYGGFARLGYGDFGFYTKYYLNDVFVDSPDQEGLKKLSFGVMFFF